MRWNIVFSVLLVVFFSPDEIRADIVGLSTENTTASGLISGGVGVNLVRVVFTTTGLSGNKLTGISFDGFSLGIGLRAELEKWNGLSYDTVASDLTLTYINPFTKINFSNIAAQELQSNSQYRLAAYSLIDVSGLTAQYSTNGMVDNFIPDWISSANQTGDIGAGGYGAAVSLYTSVPEPTTMVLTGSAITVVAIGAFFKRRRHKPIVVGS